MSISLDCPLKELFNREMPSPTYAETLEKALYELSKFIGPLERIEGAPKEEGDRGPVPNNVWREVKRDLSDVPRGERWLIRKKGTGRGNKVKGSINYIAVCLVKEPSTALQGYTPQQIEAHRALSAREWGLLQKYEEILKFKDEALEAIFSRISDMQGIAGQGITHANNAGANAALIAELTKAQSELMDDLSNAKADNNTAKGIMHIINRIVSHVQLRKVKSWDEMRKNPEIAKDIASFFEWRDNRDSPPPGDDPATEEE